MSPIQSQINPNFQQFKTNQEGMKSFIETLDKAMAECRFQGKEKMFRAT